MKLSLLSALLASVAGAGAAFADTTTVTENKTVTEVRTAPQPEPRTIEIVGLNGRTTIVINDTRKDVPQQAPYALQGSPGSGQPAKTPQEGYQAR
jgi:hypothetical protein